MLKRQNRDDGRLKVFVRRLSRNKLAVFGCVFIAALLLVALFAPMIAPYSYKKQNLSHILELPSASFLLGTDELGRDVLSRLIYGARISLSVGFFSILIALFTGGAMGAFAGYYGGKVDHIIMRIMDIFMSMPSMILAIVIQATLGPGLFNVMIAIGVAMMPQFARLLRSSVLSIREMEYIEAARAMGIGDLKIIWEHVIPNSMAPVIVQATLSLASAILTSAALSFIGLGIQPPFPEWGSMLSAGRDLIRDYPHLTLFPGLIIMLTILALNFVGDGLRDALDPKLKN